MVSMGGPNWNIPNGKLENSEDLKSFKFGKDDYDYRMFDDDDFNFLEAKQHCERYNMVLPSPKNDEQNDQIREINKDRRDRWNGDIFVENVGRKNQNALMDRKGEFEEFDDDEETDIVLCIAPHADRAERHQATDLFLNADWLWSSMGKTSSNEDLLIQMATSGYFECVDRKNCENSSERPRKNLQKQLDNAPASFLGNVMKFKTGSYFYMSTRNNNFSNRAQKGTINVSETKSQNKVPNFDFSLLRPRPGFIQG